MKRILVRVTLLGTVVGLGLIAIAQAQRSQYPEATMAANTTPPSDGSSDSSLPPAGASGNPLRPNDAPPASVSPPNPLRIDNPIPPRPIASDPPSGANPLRKPASDPFAGLRDNQMISATPPLRPLSVQVAPASAQVPSQQQTAAAPSGGPVLLAPAGGAAAKTSAPPSYPTLASSADRYAPPAHPIADSQEPAPFRADPAASPFAPPTANASHPGNVAPAGGGYISPSNDDQAAGEHGDEGTGQPGGKQLEGPQSPQLTIQKSAPPEIQVGKPATFRITVRNTGQTTAGNVEVHDQIPRGTRLLGSTPRASRGGSGELVWNLGAIKPGEESAAEVQLMPTTEGEIGSVATVHFDAAAAAHSTATRPKLAVEVTGTSHALVGDRVNLTITVSNPGSGVATGVVIEEHIPTGLQHPAGSDLEYGVGDLRPGESRKLDLQLTAKRAGPITNVLCARGDGKLRTENRFNLEVVAPHLDIALAGPKRRYLEHEATYQVAISNPGTAPARHVELVAYLPSGLKFMSANNAGQYDEANRAVHWALEELPTNEKGVVELVTMPIEPGQQSIKLRGTAQKAAAVEKEQPVVIEGIAALFFQLSQEANPIEVGGQTGYQIHVINQGSKAAGNVRLAVLLPPELKAVSAEGPSRHVIDGGRVVFDGLDRLAPKGDATYRVRVQGLQPGDLRVRCQLLSDEMQTPVTKEESTQVYADQ